jgi:hypothetical protein
MLAGSAIRFGRDMKEQYVGDISDYRKYALLRAFAAGGEVRIGVCWMLTPPDGSSDGSKLAYLRQPDRYRTHDPELFDLLGRAASEPDQRRLLTIEASGVIPDARYFNTVIPDAAVERATVMSDCQRQFVDCDLVFFDPDNGLEIPSLPKGRKNSSKFVYLDELAAFYAAGHSLLAYQHFPRVERSVFIERCAAAMRGVAPNAQHWSYRTKHVVFMAAINPASGPAAAAAAHRAASAWHPDFIAGTSLPAR